jgi:hypothetical protein
LLLATRRLQELHDLEISALVEGKPGLDRIEMALKLARGRRDQARKAYLLHIAMHGC